MFTLKLIQFI